MNKEFYKTIHNCTIQKTSSFSCLPPLPQNSYKISIYFRQFRKLFLISENNPRTLEFFRTKAEIIKERQSHIQSYPYMIHPFCIFRTYYEMFISIIYILSILFVPVLAAFKAIDKIQWVQVIVIFCNFVCLFDIIINFLTGYVETSHKIVYMNPKIVAFRYICSPYFICDLLSSLPILFNQSSMVNLVFEYLGFLKLVRCSTIFMYLIRTSEYYKINKIVETFIKLHLLCFLINHSAACIVYAIPQIYKAETGDYNDLSWIVIDKIATANFIHSYTRSFYRAASYILCIFPEISVNRNWDDIATAILMFFFGKIFITFISVEILNLFFMLSSLETKYYEKHSQLKEFLKLKNVPYETQKRVLHYFNYKYSKRYYEEEYVSELLSDNLKKEIKMRTCKKLVNNVLLFRNLPTHIIENIVAYLKPDICLPNDIIIIAGTYGDCMYFLASGEVAVITPTGKEVCHLNDGAYFGEISLLVKDKKRTANVVAVDFCEVYILERTMIKKCFEPYQELLKELLDVAYKRLEDITLIEEFNRLQL